MNLVEAIKNQLPNGALNQLSTLLGTGEGTTRNAVEAAVPALLAGLSNVASNPGGAQKLASALGKFDGGVQSRLGQSLVDQPNSLLEQGNGFLNSLLGGSTMTGISNAVSKFTGLGSGLSQKLLGYLMPLVLGAVAGRFAGKSINPQSVGNLLSEQKSNIASALPSGFSLSDVPGIGAVGSAAKAGVQTAQQAGSSALRWAVPVGALALIGLVLLVWAMNRPAATPTVAIPSGAVPDVSQVSADVTRNFTALTQSLTSIKDATSAASALPKIQELSGKLSEMKAMSDKLPEAGKAKIRDMVQANIGKLDEQCAKLLWIPGARDKLEPALDEVMAKYAALGDVPTPKAAAVSGELAGVVSSLTGLLSGVKDAASAEAALPKLKDLDVKLEASKQMMASLPDDTKATIRSLLKSAITSVQTMANSALVTTGTSATLQPVVDSIMNKLTVLAG